jgi:hypothetical protein
MCQACHSVFDFDTLLKCYSDSNKHTQRAHVAELLVGYPCISVNCYGELFDIDEVMVKPISKLNNLGIKTLYCCSGHIQNKNIDSTYISMVGNIDFNVVPDDSCLKHESKDGEEITILRFNKDLETTVDLFSRWINLHEWSDLLTKEMINFL